MKTVRKKLREKQFRYRSYQEQLMGWCTW